MSRDLQCLDSTPINSPERSMSTATRQNQSALSKEETADVIVIGAGLSGLVAARRLQEAGKHVVVLEARDRVGGRLFTTEIGDHRFDVGGQFFGPSQTAVRALADELGLKFQTTYTQGESVFETSNGVTHTALSLVYEPPMVAAAPATN